jgi:hypothetical protein
MDSPEDRDILYRLVLETIPVSRISMLGNPGLRMFYLTSFMAGNIYYSEELELAAVAEYDGENIYLQDVYSKKEFELGAVLGALMKENSRKAVLGFTPWDSTGFLCEEQKVRGPLSFSGGKIRWVREDFRCCPMPEGPV